MKTYFILLIILLSSLNISSNSFLKKRHHRSKQGEREIIIRYKKNGETGSGYTSEWRYNNYILDVKDKMEPLKRFFRAAFDRTLPQCIPEEQRLNLLKNCQDSVKSSVPINFEEFLEKFISMMTEPSCEFEAFLFKKQEFSKVKDVLGLAKKDTPAESTKDCCDCKDLTKQIDALRKKLRETFNSEMEDLYKKLIELENKNSQLNQRNGELKCEKNSLDSEIQKSEAGLKELENDLKDLSKSKAEEEAKNKECCEKLKKQKEDNDKISAEIEEKKKEIAKLNKEYQRLKDKASKNENKCCGNLDGLRSAIGKLETEKNKKEEVLKELKDKIKSLEDELNKEKGKNYCVELELFEKKYIHYNFEEVETDPCTEECCSAKFSDAVVNKEDISVTMRKIGTFEYKATKGFKPLSYEVSNIKYIGAPECLMRMEIIAPKKGQLISQLGLNGLITIHENDGFKSYAYCLNYKPRPNQKTEKSKTIITFTEGDRPFILTLNINDLLIYDYLSTKYSKESKGQKKSKAKKK